MERKSSLSQQASDTSEASVVDLASEAQLKDIRHQPIPANVLRTPSTSEDSTHRSISKQGNMITMDEETLLRILDRKGGPEVEYPRRSGRLPDPGSGLLPFFTGEGVSEYLELFEDFAEKERLTGKEKLRQFPVYCLPELRTTVKEKVSEATSWESFVEVIKEEFWSTDIQQVRDAATRLEAFYQKVMFSENLTRFIGQRRHLEDLMKKAGVPRTTTNLSKHLMGAISQDVRAWVLLRLGKTLREASQEKYDTIIGAITERISCVAYDRVDGEELLTAKDKKIVEAVRTDEPKIEAPKLKPSAIVKKAASESEEMRIKLDDLTRKFESFSQRLPSQQGAVFPSRAAGMLYTFPNPALQVYQNDVQGGEAYDLHANPAQVHMIQNEGQLAPPQMNDQYLSPDQVPVYGNELHPNTVRYDMQPNPVSIPVFRNEMQPNEGSRQGGRSGMNTSFNGSCFYCPTGAHSMKECNAAIRDEKAGLIHRTDQGLLALGEKGKGGEILPAQLFRTLGGRGQVRSSVWTFCIANPEFPSHKALRALVQTTGERVDVGDRFTTANRNTYGQRLPEGIDPFDFLLGQKPVVTTVESNFMDLTHPGIATNETGFIYATPPFAPSRIVQRGEDYEDFDGVEQLFRDVKGTMGTTPAKAKESEGNTKEPPVGVESSDLIRRTVDACAKATIRVSLKEMAEVSPAVGKLLVRTIQDVLDHVDTTILLDKFGNVVKEIVDENEGRRKRARDEDEAPRVNVPPVVQTLSMDIVPAGMTNSLGHMHVVFGNSLNEGIPADVVVDSGSGANTMDADLVKKLGLAITATDTTSRSVHGTEERFLGIVTVKMWVGGYSMAISFFVTPKYSNGPKPLLGMPFLHATKFSFEYEDEYVLYGKLIVGRARLIVPMAAPKHTTRQGVLVHPGKA